MLSSCLREERGMFILHHFNDAYALFFWTLIPTAGFNDPGWEIPGPFCSRAMLICSIIWLGKRMLRLLFCGSVLRWHEVAPYSVSSICIVWSCFYVVDADQLIRYLRHNWLFWSVWWPPRTLWYVDDNHYHFTGPSWKKVPKNIVVSSEQWHSNNT